MFVDYRGCKACPDLVRPLQLEDDCSLGRVILVPLHDDGVKSPEMNLSVDLDSLLGCGPNGVNQLIMVIDWCPTGEGRANTGIKHGEVGRGPSLRVEVVEEVQDATLLKFGQHRLERSADHLDVWVLCKWMGFIWQGR